MNIKGFELNPAWLSSTHVKKLILKLDFGEFSECDCWHLPALKTLHLTQLGSITYTLPESYLICFHSLETLFLDGFDLPISVSLPALTTLRLSSCKLPPTFWDFPALLTLTLDNIVFSDETSEFLIALVNLRKLTLFLRKNMMTDCYINCPQLMNLDINTCMNTISKHPGKIIVLSHKICNFSSVGFFAITFEESELETVNIKLRDQRYKTIASWKNMKDYYPRAIPMFPEVGSAKILTLDSETIEVLPGIFLPFSFSILKL
ncbi:hypothetical protein POM88_034935 [Heracleum sosnowskyi]|uniref:Uncharacterized protein n=1 Tax=Heracleum sosnowskyi TaxID=360622 RepID=A0AAD8HL95_9APIA|nr:hypothetical protein POM88_034935 [Heracleum sosnowskyi]